MTDHDDYFETETFRRAEESRELADAARYDEHLERARSRAKEDDDGDDET